MLSGKAVTGSAVLVAAGGVRTRRSAYGVAHILRLLKDALDASIALTGCRSLADVGQSSTWRPVARLAVALATYGTGAANGAIYCRGGGRPVCRLVHEGSVQRG